MGRRTGVRSDGTVSQRWVSEKSKVKIHVLQTLRQKGLLPGLKTLRPEDVVIARVAEAIGAHRTSFDSAAASQRHLAVIDAVRRAMTTNYSPRTLLLVTSDRVDVTGEEYEFLQAKERPRQAGEAFTVIPLGVWMGDLEAATNPDAATASREGSSIAA